MKNILKLTTLFFLFAFSAKAYSQLDTLNYVKQFEMNKANFVNKPFSYLLSHMTEIQPTTVGTITKIYGKDLAKFSLFKFCNKEYQYGRYTLSMYITWKTPISYSQANLLSKQNKFDFTNAEQTFYGDKIIENIEVVKN